MTPGLLRGASGLHRAALILYPRAFRARFGDDVQDVFDARLAAHARRGALAVVMFVGFALADLVWSGALERFAPNPQLVVQRRSLMSRDALVNDLKVALRLMRRSPLFTALTVLALAVGIGATGAIFAVANGVLFAPLPYRDPSRLVMVWSDNTHVPAASARRNPVSAANFLDYKTMNHSFVDLQPMQSFLVNYSYSDGGITEIVQGSGVMPEMFALLGRDPLLGSTLRPDEPNTALISYAFWQRRYGGDPNIVGHVIHGGGGAPVTIVGVMPKDFVFPYKSMLGPSGFTTAQTTDIWTPLSWHGQGFVSGGQLVRTVHFLGAVGRLKPGVSVADADRDMKQVAAQLAAAYPQTNTGWSATVVSLKEQAVGAVRPALVLLLAGVGVVLLIVCANVANLILSQSIARQRELAVRAALGATGAQLARQALVESLALALAGGVAATGVFAVCLGALRAMAPADTPRIGEVGVTPAVIVFMAVLTLLTSVIVAVLPAAANARTDPQGSLKDGARGTTVGRGGRRLRAGLVVAELALAVVLTAGGGLLLRSFLAVMAVDPGFASDHLLTLKANAPARIASGPAAQRLAYYDDMFKRIEAIPGVRVAGGTTRIPLGSTEVSTRLEVDGVARSAAEVPEVEFRRSMHHYFDAMGIPVVEGRDFAATDTLGSEPVAIVNQTAARVLFPDGRAIGKRVRFYTPPSPTAQPGAWLTVVGVIGDVHHSTLEDAPKPEFYVAARQNPPVSPMLAIRTAGDPAGMTETVRRALRDFDPTLPLYDMHSMAELRSTAVADRRFLLLLVGVFGGLAIALAAIGVYGVMALAVSERSSEVGVRMALGASGGNILGLVLGQAVKLGAAGIAIGIGGAFVMAPLLAHQLFGIAPFDAVTFAAVPLLLLIVAVVATLAPARRAMRVDPLVTLRGD